MPMQYAGTVVLPLYISPYEVPTELQEQFSNGFKFFPPAFDAIISTDLNAFNSTGTGGYPPYVNLINCNALDYGRYFYNPTGEGNPGAGGQLWSGNYGAYYLFEFYPGSGESNGYANIYATGLPVQGGVDGEQYSIPPYTLGYYPIDLRDDIYAENNCAYPICLDDGQVVQMWSSNNAAAFYYMNQNGEQFGGGTTSGGNVASFAFQFGNQDAVVGQGTGDGPVYIPVGLYSMPQMDTGGGPAYTPALIEFDGSYSELEPTDVTEIQNGPLMVTVADVQTWPDQFFTTVLMDFGNNVFYLLRFIAQTPDAVTALNDNSKGVPSVKYTQTNGTFLISNAESVIGKVFNTTVLNIPYFPIVLDPPTPFVLPCFNPCIPFMAPNPKDQ